MAHPDLSQYLLSAIDQDNDPYEVNSIDIMIRSHIRHGALQITTRDLFTKIARFLYKYNIERIILHHKLDNVPAGLFKAPQIQYSDGLFISCAQIPRWLYGYINNSELVRLCGPRGWQTHPQLKLPNNMNNNDINSGRQEIFYKKVNIYSNFHCWSRRRNHHVMQTLCKI